MSALIASNSDHCDDDDDDDDDDDWEGTQDLLIIISNIWFFYPGVRHPGLETFLKNTTSAIKANVNFLNQNSKPAVSGEEKTNQESASTWYSIFPVENVDLVYGNWEDKIIWDAEVRIQHYYISLYILLLRKFKWMKETAQWVS